MMTEQVIGMCIANARGVSLSRRSHLLDFFLYFSIVTQTLSRFAILLWCFYCTITDRSCTRNYRVLPWEVLHLTSEVGWVLSQPKHSLSILRVYFFRKIGIRVFDDYSLIVFVNEGPR